MAITYKQEKMVKLHRVPGLPIMLLAVLCFSLLYQITSRS
jgi:hypothetical protein